MNPTTLPFLLALSVGFAHAFEADHLVAVGNLVTRRQRVWHSLKDGAFWGLGHSSTLLLAGGVFLLGKYALEPGLFRYLEAAVGLMLLLLGAGRLWRLLTAAPPRPHAHQHPHVHHRLAYGVGMVHGLAGSGALLLSVLTQIKSPAGGMLYLVLFGVGSIAGMMVAAGAFSLPFSARLLANERLQQGLALLAAVLCMGLGVKVLYENLLVA